MMAIMIPATSMPPHPPAGKSEVPAGEMPGDNGAYTKRPQMPDIGMANELPVLEIRLVAFLIRDAPRFVSRCVSHVNAPSLARPFHWFTDHLRKRLLAVPFRFQVRKNARQQISPFALPGRRRNFIVANLDHHAWQTTRTRVAFERMVDAVGGRIWFVVADNHAIQDAERGNERRRQPAVLIVEHPDMPWPRHLFVDRRERVNGNQPCVAPLRKPVRTTASIST